MPKLGRVGAGFFMTYFMYINSFCPGARQQPRNAELRAKKHEMLKKKHETYLRHARKFNDRFNPAPRLLEPSLEDVLAMDLLDPFWNEGALNHPTEPWATCKSTKDGIVLFRSMRSSEEELRCLGREVRQLMLWGLDYQARVDSSKPNEADGRSFVSLPCVTDNADISCCFAMVFAIVRQQSRSGVAVFTQRPS